ncbi:type 1 fimbrial protein [Salmonella enterica]|nr:type 1 fimbrial protein [Salmonella enterica]EBG1336169.1 type 1 fimbrial protein [Salmonella enterica]ECD8518508.1 type 1 fimbrial protein [Salmonella enterica]ECK6780691.1 type 1 fimbrial protein [Salmonella enterica]
MSQVSATRTVLISGLLFLAAIYSGHAACEDAIDGNYGQIQVSGILAEASCSLAMTSVYQEIVFPVMTPAELRQDKVPAIVADVQLLDCPVVDTEMDDVPYSAYSRGQPLASIRINSPEDSHNPALFKVYGAAGFGLHLYTINGDTILPGKKNKPFYLYPGMDSVAFKIKPESTYSGFKPGVWQSTINFSLVYY